MQTITTDSKWKNFKYGYEVPAKVRADYDHISEDDGVDSWICYRKRWYHLSDFMRCDGNSEWDGVHGDSFFSGVLIKISRDGESYKIGTAYS